MPINSQQLYDRVIGKIGNPSAITFADLLNVLSEFQAVYSIGGTIVDSTNPLIPTLNTSNFPSWQKLHVTATDLAAAATTKQLNIDLLQINEIIHAVVVVPTTQFSGGTIASYAITVGVSGAQTKYLGSSDMLAAPSGTLFYAKTPTAIVPESNDQTTVVSIWATSDVNTNVATHGAFDIYWLTSLLP